MRRGFISRRGLLRRGGAIRAIDRGRTFRILALSTAVATYGTMVLGSYTSSIGAGLACPDWPLCHGAVVPDLGNPLILAEYAHRLVAALTGLFLAATLATALLWFRHDRRALFLAGGTATLLAGQVTLGMVTIASRLNPVVVTMHLALAAAVFAFTVLLAVLSWRIAPPRAPTAAGP